MDQGPGILGSPGGKKICTAIHHHHRHHPDHNNKNITSASSCPQEGVRCRNTFDFCWDASKLRRQKASTKTKRSRQEEDEGGWQWC
jgi:hypothetical protein